MSPSGPEPVARIKLRVAPGAKRTELVGRHGDAWKVRVDAPPERGKANERVRKLLADLTGARLADVDVVTGSTSRNKLVEVRGVHIEELERMLDAESGK